ncbi:MULTISPECIES: M28 family metallopeptidase [unclassified Brevundimonas]|uniref:M28 family metallopeptidase n=1 Tax=unclassified Brevundimonas TaxID=2622653 RepID=UPI0025BC5BA3|nr:MULTISPECIES: M20/M25/M40 family metallo-hydrolase [unclassified Brevundimonas]
MLLRSALAGCAALALIASAQLAHAETSAAGQAIENAARALIKTSNAERLEVLKIQLSEAGIEYTLQTFEGGNRQTGAMAGTNIVLTFGEGQKDLVMTAHYDAVVLRSGGFSHGVVDNAGGTLAVVEAAKALKAHAAHLNHRIVVVLTDQEELGLIGASKWLEQADRTRINAVVNVDVAAYGRTVMFGLNNGEQSAGLVRILSTQCAVTATDCEAFPVYPPSDDRVFSRAGIPVLSLGIQNAIGARQMWLAFNGGEDNGLREGFVPDVFQNIHTDQDTIDKLKGDDVAAFSEFLTALVRQIDTELGPR